MSLRLYSEEHGLKAGKLGYWNSRLKAQAADAPAPSAGPEAAFLAVQVAEPTVTMPEPRDDRIELTLPGGCVVRVGRGFDAATLDRLLTLVERRSRSGCRTESVFTWRRVARTCAAALMAWPRRSRRCCAKTPSASSSSGAARPIRSRF